MIRIDLHTHSTASPDGGISAQAYAKALATGFLNFIAITDHNSIDFALKVHDDIGDQIIVGEEIMTKSGEVIGLYLNKLVPPNLELEETVLQIKSQGGLVYVPHPLEKTRSGISETDLEKITEDIDIIESVNGRAFVENHTKAVQEFAAKHNIVVCGSSDAHGTAGWGQTYTSLSENPTKETLLSLLKGSHITYKRPSFRALLYPKYNRMRKRFL